MPVSPDPFVVETTTAEEGVGIRLEDLLMDRSRSTEGDDGEKGLEGLLPAWSRSRSSAAEGDDGATSAATGRRVVANSGARDSPFDERRADLGLHLGGTPASPKSSTTPPAIATATTTATTMLRSDRKPPLPPPPPAPSSIEMMNAPPAAAPDGDGTPSYFLIEPTRSSGILSRLSFSQKLREFRHNSCLMTPLSFLILSALLLTSLVGLILAAPQMLLGLILGPLVRRSQFLVEFLYAWDVARWGHLKILSWGTGKKNKAKALPNPGGGAENSSADVISPPGGHSATLGRRIEVVPGRVYVHPVPQLLDNLAYLVVCCPPPPAPAPAAGGGQSPRLLPPLSTPAPPPVVGLLIDCGDADGAKAYLDAVHRRWYSGYGDGIELRAVLCTHRHHDHTAGVKELVRWCAEDRMKRRRGGEAGDDDSGGKEKGMANNAEGSEGSGRSGVYDTVPGGILVVGAAVERVPCCNLFVRDGCFVPLPSAVVSAGAAEPESPANWVNDMNDCVSIEVVGVPSHTRGSVVYALRNRPAPGMRTTAPPSSSGSESPAPPVQSHLFTGDTIFIGGGGVPFEADIEYGRDQVHKNPRKLNQKHGSSPLRPGSGMLSIERCFIEVLTRAFSRQRRAGTDSSSLASSLLDRALIYPGHEYTSDLLMRQFDQKSIPTEAQWTRLAPSAFFETASQYFDAAHRRSLPKGSKMCTAPTTLRREMVANPNYRSLRRRGEHLVHALRLWHDYGARERLPVAEASPSGGGVGAAAPAHDDGGDDGSVFATVYAADLRRLVRDLRAGSVDPAAAADALAALPARLDEQAVGRRPIPSKLPSHKNVYLGVVALAALGSAPSAATVSDANIMGMAEPVENSDGIFVSRKRLIATLECFGLLRTNPMQQRQYQQPQPRIEDIVLLLWKEARPDANDGAGNSKRSPNDEFQNDLDVETASRNYEEEDDRTDLLELGFLKLALFGASLNQRSWLSKFCLPCGGGGQLKLPKNAEDVGAWTTKSKMKRTKGELVRHDAEICMLCSRGVTIGGGECECA